MHHTDLHFLTDTVASEDAFFIGNIVLGVSGRPSHLTTGILVTLSDTVLELMAICGCFHLILVDIGPH